MCNTHIHAEFYNQQLRQRLLIVGVSVTISVVDGTAAGELTFHSRTLGAKQPRPLDAFESQ